MYEKEFVCDHINQQMVQLLCVVTERRARCSSKQQSEDILASPHFSSQLYHSIVDWKPKFRGEAWI